MVHEPAGGLVADFDDHHPGATARPLSGWIALPAAAGLIAIVALASRSASTPAAGLALDLLPVLTAIRVIGYVGLAIGTIALPYIIAYRLRRLRSAVAPDAMLGRRLRPVPWWARLLGIAVLAGVFMFQVAILIAYLAELRRATAGASGGRSGGPFGLGPDAFGGAGEDTTALVIALGILIALGVLFVVVAIRWRMLDAATGTSVVGRRAAVVEAVELSLDALRREPDPRRAVIAAYAAMERSLSGAGIGRLRSEAPMEYLRRVIAAPTNAGEDVRTITLLFQHAKFSNHVVEETMRSRAIDALARIRAAIGGQG